MLLTFSKIDFLVVLYRYFQKLAYFLLELIILLSEFHVKYKLYTCRGCYGF